MDIIFNLQNIKEGNDDRLLYKKRIVQKNLKIDLKDTIEI